MAHTVVLLSGGIATGKSTLSMTLHDKFGATIVKTNRVLLDKYAGAVERKSLQEYGEALDIETGGRWVADAVVNCLQGTGPDTLLVVDAIRILPQAEEIRKHVHGRVLHIHLLAPKEELVRRFEARRGDKPFKEALNYEDVLRSTTEQRIEGMKGAADIVIDTAESKEADVVARAAGHLGLYGREYIRLVDVLVGGQYGSEGKGHIAFFLAPEYDVLVRVGGPNAGHTVYDNGPYIHHQLPSGTRACKAFLIVGPGAVIDPAKLLKEISECNVGPERLLVDHQAMIIEESDKAEEFDLVKNIASTGQGVGVAATRRILGRGRGDVRLARDVPALKPFIGEALEKLERAFYRRERVFVEGTQGAGLSLFHGPYPHVTSRDTTVSGVLAEAGISPRRVRKLVMTCRPYPIRVQNPPGGTSGPLNEIGWDTVSARSHVPIETLKATEKTSTTKKDRRVGEFEWDLLRKAASLNGPTDIALTFADYIDAKNQNAYRFEQLTEETLRFTEELERIAAAPVSLISTGFGRRTIIDRRAW